MRTWCFTVALLLSFVVLFAADSALARGFLGERFISIRGGIIRPGDDEVRDIDDSIVTGGVGVNVPMSEQLDIRARASYSKLDGDEDADTVMGPVPVSVEVEGYSIGVGADMHFKPDDQVDPFVGVTVGLRRSKAEANVSALGITDEAEEEDASLTVTVGAEVDVSASAAVTGVVGYQLEDESNDDGFAEVAFNIWLSEMVGLYVSGGIAFDDEDTRYGGGLLIGF
jgi:hypothetical protein